MCLRCEIKDVDSPIARVRNIEDQQLINQIDNLYPQCNWTACIRVLSAYYLPEKDRDYEIKVCVQDKSVVLEVEVL